MKASTFVSLSLLLAFFFIRPSHAETAQVSALLQRVCNKTAYYSFCVDSLCSDPRAPDADRFVLADVSFRLAYRNASSTQDHIDKMLNLTAPGESKRLQQCRRDYKEAITALEKAYGDLDTETYFDLADLAGAAAHAAADCQAAINGTNSLLVPMNNNMKRLSEICVVISKLFTGS